MTGPLISGGHTSADGSSGGHETRARCPAARWILGLVGFFGYLIPGALFAMVVLKLLDAVGVDTSVAMNFGILLSVPVFAAWRGSTVAALVRPGEVVVRNRWRTTVVPLGDIEAVEVGTSLTYALVGVGMSIWYLFSSYSAVDPDLFDQSDMLLIRRRGHKRLLAVSATLGMGLHVDAMQPFFEALDAAGHPIEPQGGGEQAAS